MPRTSSLSFLPAVFRRKREPMLKSTSLSNFSSESVEASTRPYMLPGPLITPGGTPGWATQPWHYVFQHGDVAWAHGGNGRWRLVSVIGDSFVEKIDNRKQITYNVTWKGEVGTLKGSFSPLCGDLKPDTPAVRRLILDEGPRCVERKDWELLTEEGDTEEESVEDEESEGEELESDEHA